MIAITPIADELKRRCPVFHGHVYAYGQLEEMEDSTDYPIAIVRPGAEEVLPNDVIGSIVQYYTNTFSVDIECKTEQQMIDVTRQTKDALIGWDWDVTDPYSAIEYAGGNFIGMQGDILAIELNFNVTSFQNRAKRT